MRSIFIGLLTLSMLGTHAQETDIRYLSGTDAANTVSWDFKISEGRRAGAWTKIAVPSCWEQQGFGAYNYGRDYKTDGKNSRFADEKGSYRHKFQVPAAWKGRTIEIVFEGSMTDTEVRINGKSAGPVHRGAFYRFRHDISDLVKYGGENLLEVEVSKMSADPSVNNAERLADYWIFGGIFRPVWLEAKPRAHIASVAVDARHDGRLSITADIRGPLKGTRMAWELSDARGKVILQDRTLTQPADSLQRVEAVVSNVRAWTSETPELYRLRVSLQDATGKTIHRTQERIGFRTIEVRRGQGVFVNGVQVKFKGVNRHCFWPETARTLSREQQEMDVRLLKEMNMNAVRCSHYPPDQYFLELCDSAGIYVINELAGWQKAYSTAAGTPLVKEMVLRDRNHPSIVMWANGNEGGTNKSLDGLFTQWDLQRRPVIHPHHRPGNDFNRIDCNQYEEFNSTRRILQDSLIFLPTEFLHAQDDGGGGAALQDFWELHWSAPRSAGGFIWAFVDEAVARTDMNGYLDANGLNGNDGILGPHREKEGSYYAMREIFSPVKVSLTSHAPSDFNGSVPLENRFHFTNLSSCRYRFEIVDWTGPFERMTGARAVSSVEGVLPNIAPGSKGMLSLLLPAGFRNHDAGMLTIFDPHGQPIGTWTTLLRPNGEIVKGFLRGRTDSLRLSVTNSTVSLGGGEVNLLIDRRTGYLIRATNKSNDFPISFTGGPLPARGNHRLKEVQTNRTDSSVSAIFRYEGELEEVIWSIRPDGWATLDYTINPIGPQPFAGISFRYPNNYMLGAKWLGKGPARQWKNRMAGTPVGVWQNLYNNTQTGYSPIQYPEFKGHFGEIVWMELNTVEGKIYIATPQSGMFVRLFDFNGLTTNGSVYPPLPVGDISFLEGIPPIGTKLAMGVTSNAAVYGPMGEPNRFNGPLHRTLYIHFGMPRITDKAEKHDRPLIDNVF
jgi:hypothetical protein